MPTATTSSQKFGDSHRITHSDDEKQNLLDNQTSSDEEQDQHFKSENESDQIYNKILEDGPFIIGDENPLTPVHDVSWLDPSKITVAMTLFKEYFVVYVVTTVIVMLTLAVSVKPISTLIFCNNKPMKKEEYFRRFVGKLRGTERFFTLFQDPNEIRKVFYKTRKLHTMAMVRLNKLAEGKPLPEVIVWQEEQWMRDVVKAAKKDVASIPRNLDHPKLPQHIVENLSWNTELQFNQFSMVYFTAAFFGSVWKHPQLFGMKDNKDPKMLAFIHMWALIAKMLGLQDEFNIYINPDPKLIDRIIDDVYLHSLDNIDTCVVNLQDMVARGIAVHIPIVTQRQALCFSIQGLGCKNAGNLWKLLSFKDKALFKIVEGILWTAGNVAWFRHFINWLFQRFVHRLYRVVLDKPVEKEKYLKS